MSSARRRLGSRVTSKFLREIEKLGPLRSDFGQAVREGLRKMLGESAAYATLYHLGEEALKDPFTLAGRMERLFGFGAKIVLNRILDEIKVRRKGSKTS